MRIGILPSVNFFKTETGCKAGDKCLFPHHKVDEPTEQKAEKSDNSHQKRERRQECSGYWERRQECCVSQDSESLESERGKQSRRTPMQKVLGSIRRTRFTQSTLRQASLRENKGPSLGKIQVKHPHQRSPHGMKFEEWSQEETDRQQRCARSKAWNLAKNIYKLKEKDKATFYSLAEEWVLPVAETKEPEKREFVVDSGASMHMVSKRNLNAAELETVRTSRSSTTVMTANGEVQTRKEATENVKELDLFMTVMFP